MTMKHPWLGLIAFSFVCFAALGIWWLNGYIMDFRKVDKVA